MYWKFRCHRGRNRRPQTRKDPDALCPIRYGSFTCSLCVVLGVRHMRNHRAEPSPGKLVESKTVTIVSITQTIVLGQGTPFETHIDIPPGATTCGKEIEVSVKSGVSFGAYTSDAAIDVGPAQVVIANPSRVRRRVAVAPDAVFVRGRRCCAFCHGKQQLCRSNRASWRLRVVHLVHTNRVEGVDHNAAGEGLCCWYNQRSHCRAWQRQQTRRQPNFKPTVVGMTRILVKFKTGRDSSSAYTTLTGVGVP